MDPFVGLRRPADLQPRPAPESDAALVARITGEIQATGPMTFARFMDLALYDPAGGYYTGEDARPGRTGDFLTAPEAHPIFGWALARQADELWGLLGRPDPFVICEHGAGTGALILAILDGLAREGSGLLDAVRYQPVEAEPRRIEALRERLGAAGHSARLEAPVAEASGPMTGLVLANEVLDALPVHWLRGTEDGFEELYVTACGGELGELAGPPSTAALAQRLATEGIVLRPGQLAEVCLALDGWVAAAAARLRRGLLLLIDYGHPAVELYDPVRRPRGTLLAYRHHRAVDDPFGSVGHQDLTAHVDVTAVERAANRAGLATVGITTQAELLAGLGAGDLLADLRDRPDTALDAYLEARMALLRMLDPAAMGRFRAMAFGRGLPESVALRGFSFRLPGR